MQMDHDDNPQQMSAETRDLLQGLSREDVAVIKRGLPILKAVLGFGTVVKWIAIVLGGLLAGVIFLGESVQKLASWFWPH